LSSARIGCIAATTIEKAHAARMKVAVAQHLCTLSRSARRPSSDVTLVTHLLSRHAMRPSHADLSHQHAVQYSRGCEPVPRGRQNTTSSSASEHQHKHNFRPADLHHHSSTTQFVNGYRLARQLIQTMFKDAFRCTRPIDNLQYRSHLLFTTLIW